MLNISVEKKSTLKNRQFFFFTFKKSLCPSRVTRPQDELWDEYEVQQANPKDLALPEKDILNANTLKNYFVCPESFIIFNDRTINKINN